MTPGQPTAEERRTLEEQFRRFDKNGDGQIDPKELLILMQAIGQNPSRGEIEEMIHEVDEDGSGTINFTEFIVLMRRHAKQTDVEADLKAAFRIFDKDGDGFISATEFKEVMTQLGERMTDEEFEDMMAEADVDKDGQINYEEFIALMSK